MAKHAKKKSRRIVSKRDNWNHPTHPIVANALKQIAQQNELPYEKVKHLFSEEQDRDITIQFWNIIHKEYGEQYGNVSFCKTCEEFFLQSSVSGLEGL